jgi:hypothetical protein
VDPDPRDDQAAVRKRDLTRLLELAEPHMAADDILGSMNPADRTEALAILERLGGVTEDPQQERERQKTLLALAQIEADLRALLAKGDPRMRNGKVLRDPQTGEMLRNRTTDRRLRAQLRELERLRSRITGLPPAGDDQAEPDEKRWTDELGRGQND